MPTASRLAPGIVTPSAHACFPMIATTMSAAASSSELPDAKAPQPSTRGWPKSRMIASIPTMTSMVSFSASPQLAAKLRDKQHHREPPHDGGDRIGVGHYFAAEERGMQRPALFDGSVGSGARPPRPRLSR